MTEPCRARCACCVLGALLLGGCYLSNDGRDGGRDAARSRDSSADGSADGAIPGDAGECLSFGATRLCGEFCPRPCPSGSWCEAPWQACVQTEAVDPRRGYEYCRASVDTGRDYCYSGRLCAVIEATFDPVTRPGGRCVDEGYCAWAPENAPEVRCVYSEGHWYTNGPPDVPCGTGAQPESGFCGGACGDTCFHGPVFGSMDPPACVGISEERGFGVCVPYTYRCVRERGLERTMRECRVRIASLGAPPLHCACMLLAPALVPEYAEHGWAVAEQTCLAYREHFPDQVRCMSETWSEL